MNRQVDPVRLLKGLYRHFTSKAQASQESLRSGADSAQEVGFARGVRYAAATIKDIFENISDDDIEAEDEDETEVMTCQLM